MERLDIEFDSGFSFRFGVRGQFRCRFLENVTREFDKTDDGNEENQSGSTEKRGAR